MRVRSQTRRWIAGALAVLVLLPGCSHRPSEPKLPDDTDPNTVHQLDPGPAGQEFLKSISTYQWGDKAETVAGLFQWIPQSATGPDSDKRAKAATSAHVLASFLADNADSLQHIGGQNPALTQSYTLAIAPYLGSLVVNDPLTPQFPPLDPLDGAMPKTRALFTVLAGDPTSSVILGQAIDRQVAQFEDDLSEVARRQHPTEQALSAPILSIARLIALASTADVHSPPSRLDWGAGTEETQLNYIIARAAIKGPNEDILPKYITADGEFMSPLQVRLKFGESAWSDYASAVSAYISRTQIHYDAMKGFHQTLRTIKDGAQAPHK